jgi:hypothetical protein
VKVWNLKESYNIRFSVIGTYKDGLSPAGYVLSDHMLLGSVVATILVIVVTAQVSSLHTWSVFASFVFFSLFEVCQGLKTSWIIWINKCDGLERSKFCFMNTKTMQCFFMWRDMCSAHASVFYSFILNEWLNDFMDLRSSEEALMVPLLSHVCCTPHPSHLLNIWSIFQASSFFLSTGSYMFLDCTFLYTWICSLPLEQKTTFCTVQNCNFVSYLHFDVGDGKPKNLLILVCLINYIKVIGTFVKRQKMLWLCIFFRWLISILLQNNMNFAITQSHTIYDMITEANFDFIFKPSLGLVISRAEFCLLNSYWSDETRCWHRKLHNTILLQNTCHYM